MAVISKAGNASALIFLASARDWTTRHPEWWSLSISAAAWGFLLRHPTTAGSAGLCLSRPGNGIGDFAGMIVDWTIMTLAMVPPLAVPVIRHVATRSFSGRKIVSVGEFLGGAIMVWLLAGLAVLSLSIALPRPVFGNPALPPAAFLMVALWQFTPAKRLALLRCHRTFPLVPMGWQADWHCAEQGVRYGLGCVASCWAMMLGLMVVSHGATSFLVVQMIALFERRMREFRPLPSAIGLSVWAGVTYLMS